MILSSHGLIASSLKGGFDADYQAVLDYATSLGYTLPSSGQQVKQNQLMLDLKAGGIWSKLDTFAIFATDGSSSFALIDWKRLVTYTAVNSPTFSTNGGFTGNGTSSHINTNFNPATQAINYALNNAHHSCQVDNVTSGFYFGSASGTRNTMGNYNLTFNVSINGTATLNSSADMTGSGYKAINRTSSTNLELFNGTTQLSRTQASSDVGNISILLLRNSNTYGNLRIRYYANGASLVSENTAFRTAISTYLTSL